MAEQTHAVARRATDAVVGVAEHAFGSVAAVRDVLVEQCAAAMERGKPLSAGDIAALRDPIVACLREPSAVPVGLGVIVAPDVLRDERLYLEWWQATDDQPARLEVDLKAGSIGFYDYVTAEWFEQPRRTGRRHVVGPYVDVHGTDRYVLTLTEPIWIDGRFVGVAGADVSAARFEGLVLSELGDAPADLIVVSTERRVVLSSSSQWLVGSLLHRRPRGAVWRDLPDLPWQVAVRTHE